MTYENHFKMTLENIQKMTLDLYIIIMYRNFINF